LSLLPVQLPAEFTVRGLVEQFALGMTAKWLYRAASDIVNPCRSADALADDREESAP